MSQYSASAASARGFVSTGIALVAVLAVTAGAQVPAPLAPGWLRAERSVYGAVWPQGWSFFADTPQMPVFTVYRLAGASSALTELTRGHMSAANDWGLSRLSAAQFVETEILVQEVPGGAWRTCDTSPTACVAGLPVLTVTNPFPNPLVCGPVVIERRPPWPRQDAAGEVTVLDVACR